MGASIFCPQCGEAITASVAAGEKVDCPHCQHAFQSPKTAKRPGSQSLLLEFWAFIKHEKKWWMIPLVLVLLLVAGLMLFAQSSPLAPFIYPLF